MSYSRYVSIKDFRRMLLSVADPENPFVTRDRALLVVLYSTGMTLSEIANLKASNVLNSAGKLLPSFDLEDGKSSRRIHWVKGWVEKIAEDYIEWRKVQFPAHFSATGAIKPSQSFFVNDFGTGFKEHAVRQVEDKVYSSSTELSLLIREIHQAGKVAGGNAESARRSFSVWLALGHFTGSPVHVDWIRQARGDQRLSTTMSAIQKDLPKDFDPLAAVFESAVPLRTST